MDVLGLVDIPIWLILVIFVVLLSYIHYQKNFTIWKRYGIPGPTPLPFIGNMAGLFKRGIMENDAYLYKTYGKVFGVYEGPWATLFIADPDILKHVLIKDFDTFTNRRGITLSNSKANDITEKLLTRLENEQWKHVRNIVSPTFTSGKLRQYTKLINNVVDTAMVKLDALADKGEKFEAKHLCSGFTLDVIAQTAFGVQTDAQTSSNDPFVKHAKVFFDIGFLRVFVIAFLFPCIVKILKKLNIKWNFSSKVTESVEFFKEITELAMKERKKNPSNYSDFLQLMVDVHNEHKTEDSEGKVKEGLSTNEVVAQALIFFLAGYETTGTTLAFVMYNLATNPECMENVIQELDDELGEEVPTTYENVNKLNYLEQCISETLRMYPPAFRFDRVASKEITIKGVTIPAKSVVTVPAMSIHRDPAIYTDPDKFDPSRFTKEEISKRNQFHYLPFGAGPRNCIGMRLALLEMKLLLANILQKYRLTTCEDTQIPLKLNKWKGLQTEKGIWLKVEKK